MEVLCGRIKTIRDKFQATKIRPIKSQIKVFYSFASKITKAVIDLSKVIRALTESRRKRPTKDGSKLLAKV
jgi:hypothetical protein